MPVAGEMLKNANGGWLAGAAATATVTVAEATPPPPAQSRVKLELLMSGPTLSTPPELVFAPSQSPLATQLSALVASQFRSTLSPAATRDAAALRSTMGTSVVALVPTTTVSVLIPPRPMHVKLNAVWVTNACVVKKPVVATSPDQPPAARHSSAFAEAQLNSAGFPAATLALTAENATSGGIMLGCCAIR